MGRQARSEATRNRIILSAVQLFAEIGYAAASLGDIIERAELTKGAFYYHFDSKEALATAIIEEGSDKMFGVFNRIRNSSAPAMERIIHGCFLVAAMIGSDMVARSGTHLLRAFGQYNRSAGQIYERWVDEIVARVQEAVRDGDLRPELDARAVSETIVSAMLGAELLSNASSSGADVLLRMTRIWEVLLTALVTEDSLEYFRQYLARESMRHSADAADDDAAVT
ncbi:TetR/AcrR family transcriptional regulator [Mycolicibacterium flavescens]|uniref:TetR family transcriptional regulator n=1 Tax=Mycolicibacterium flavescens TaxID=1776 RepID=A0A1E3RS34_MYCFV|nr:ScbR family autoregulator-binding transcription factor [Mycolicibacterium flavescens]MCV7279893.1 TetR/AcrR family transcriptional regulator [Mycolicibacterium flavescens]ODQ92654.1 TetR family transcriptional regulator [Mycolicibacterium flavescens]